MGSTCKATSKEDEREIEENESVECRIRKNQFISGSVKTEIE
jgi:hypothetical protein